MAQSDVYAGVGRAMGYVVELQSDLLERLAVRVVAPIVPGDPAIAISRLTPLIRFNGAEHLLLTYQMASLPIRELQRPVGSLFADQDAIKRALDILFLGFRASQQTVNSTRNSHKPIQEPSDRSWGLSTCDLIEAPDRAGSALAAELRFKKLGRLCRIELYSGRPRPL